MEFESTSFSKYYPFIGIYNAAMMVTSTNTTFHAIVDCTHERAGAQPVGSHSFHNSLKPEHLYYL